MRELKFRAWDEKKNIMHENFQFIQSGDEGNDWVCFTSDKQPNIHDAVKNPHFSQQLKKMQFTGLKDKNGKEVYEGDIIIGEQYYLKGDGYKKKGCPDIIKVICVVEFRHGSFRYPRVVKPVREHQDAADQYSYRGVGYSLDPLSKGTSAYNDKTKKWDIKGDDQTCLAIEIIGNIYEHPELLNP